MVNKIGASLFIIFVFGFCLWFDGRGPNKAENNNPIHSLSAGDWWMVKTLCTEESIGKDTFYGVVNEFIFMQVVGIHKIGGVECYKIQAFSYEGNREVTDEIYYRCDNMQIEQINRNNIWPKKEFLVSNTAGVYVMLPPVKLTVEQMLLKKTEKIGKLSLEYIKHPSNDKAIVIKIKDESNRIFYYEYGEHAKWYDRVFMLYGKAGDTLQSSCVKVMSSDNSQMKADEAKILWKKEYDKLFEDMRVFKLAELIKGYKFEALLKAANIQYRDSKK